MKSRKSSINFFICMNSTRASPTTTDCCKKKFGTQTHSLAITQHTHTHTHKLTTQPQLYKPHTHSNNARKTNVIA